MEMPDLDPERRLETDAVEQLPAAFWLRQRQAILEAARRPAPMPFRRAAAAVSLLVLLALALLLGGNSPTARAPQTLPFYRAEDQKFLSEVQVMVNRVEPQALAPAALLIPAAQQEALRQ